MSDIILHHYPTSTFSERVRLAFGLKELAWRSVEIPAALPKPELLPLTGGYRRTPVLQVGADVYCDTALILRKIEALHPEPSLFPDGSEGIALAVMWWADTSVFGPALGIVADTIAEKIPPAFVAERKAFGFPLSREDVGPQVPRHLQQGAAHLALLARTLVDGRPFLLGRRASAADLAAFCPLWLLRHQGGPDAEARLPLAPLRGWYDRVAAIGHGRPSPMVAAEALDLALRCEPAALAPRDADPSGLRVGDTVEVTPDDTGRDPVRGTLVAADAEEVVLRRSDPRVGDVHVHFPRAGFDLIAA